MAKPDWDAIKREYTAGELSIRAIAERYGVSDTAIRKVAKKEDWVRPDKVRKIGSHTPTANQSANLRTNRQKTATDTTAKSQINLPVSDSAQNDETEFNLRNYRLTDLQARFVAEYLIDLNRTAAYKRAGGKCEGHNAYASASQLYRNIEVNRAIRDALTARERRAEITQDAVLKMWWDIATADVSELTEYRRLCCRHCWGFGFNYQWRDSIEFEDAVSEAMRKSQRPPNDRGGYGYDSTLDPNPDCPRCNGAGIGRSYFHDTRDLRGASRRLFAGIKEGKFGTEVITRNQDEALKMVAQHLGMLKNRTELTGKDGEPIKAEVANLSSQEAADLYKKLMG